MNPAGGFIREACSTIRGHHLMKRHAWSHNGWLVQPFARKKAKSFDSSHAARSPWFRVILTSPEMMTQSPSPLNADIQMASMVSAGNRSFRWRILLSESRILSASTTLGGIVLSKKNFTPPSGFHIRRPLGLTVMQSHTNWPRRPRSFDR